jgi:ABC-type nickel/cobalt efflux system permease component RcnA
LALAATPALAWAQATSPFMTGATALQTNILAWLTPIAVILVMALGAMAMANRLRSERAEGLRADYRRRVEQRARARDETTAARPAVAAGTRDLAEVRSEARRAWLALRRQALGEHSAAAERGADAVPEPEEDLGL